MSPATWPRDEPLEERLLHIDPGAGTYRDRRVRDLPSLLRAGDLLVVNDAATLPASLPAHDARGRALEVRLVARREDGSWSAVLFGEGDWRTPTEHRPAPVALSAGDSIRFDHPSLGAVVERLSTISPRLVELRFDQGPDDGLWSAIYRIGRPIQYSYVRRALALWAVQTPYASRPWAVELPSAGRPLRWSLLLEMRKRGVVITQLTHAAGLSSTGDAAIDAALPLAEQYEIPDETASAVRETRARGGRVVAVGTTVVRALEGSVASNGEVTAGAGTTDLRIDRAFRPRVVAGLLTGVHDRTTTHFELVHAFAPSPLLERAHVHAEAAGYLCHEFGDSALVLAA